MTLDLVTFRPRQGVAVQAVQVTRGNAGEVAAWCGGRLVELPIDPPAVRIDIPISGGIMTQAELDDWVIRVAEGRFMATSTAHLAESFELAAVEGGPATRAERLDLEGGPRPTPTGYTMPLHQGAGNASAIWDDTDRLVGVMMGHAAAEWAALVVDLVNGGGVR